MIHIAKLALLLVAGNILCSCSSTQPNIMVRAVAPPDMGGAGASNDVLVTARSRLEDGHLGLAISLFRQAAEADPQSAAAQNGLGVAYAKLGRPDLARSHFEQAAALAPNNLAYGRNLAQLDREEQILVPSVALVSRFEAPVPVARGALNVIRIDTAGGGARIVRVAAQGSVQRSRPAMVATPTVRPAQVHAAVRTATHGKLLIRRIDSVRLQLDMPPTQATLPKLVASAGPGAASTCQVGRQVVLPATSLTVRISDCRG